MILLFSYLREGSVRRFPLFLFLLALAVASCTAPQPSGTPVAQVNDRVLTMEMITAATANGQEPTPAEARAYARRWVTTELLYQEAQQRGIDASEPIQQKLTEARRQLSIAELLEKEVYALAAQEVRREDVAEYFQKHSEDFTLHETLIRLSVAIFHEQDQANAFRSAAISGGDWNAAVEQFRTDPAKGMMSCTDSIFYTRSSLYPQELWKVAGALGMSEISFPIKTSVGQIVLRSLGQFKENTVAPLAYVETEIRNRLAMERRQERYRQFLQQLRSKHTVTMMLAGSDSTGGTE